MRGHRRTWVLGGGGARGAAQVGVLMALFEAGVEPPARLVGVSVGALNGATIAAFPSSAGAAMLREMWLSKLARDVFRAHPLGWVLNRLRNGTASALPASNVARLIERNVHLTGVERFEGLKVPLEVLATDIAAGRPRVFRSGPLLPPLLASTAIPGVFPPVDIDGAGYLDGGIVDNLPVELAVTEGSQEVLAVGLMAGAGPERVPATWTEMISRTLELSLHYRMLSDFERVRRRARVVVICPALPFSGVSEMRREHVEHVIEGSRQAALRLLREKGRRLFARSGLHLVEVAGE